MLTMLLLVYVLPIYLVFFHFKWIRLNALWWTVIILPPVLAGFFVWFAMGRYVPTTQDAYVQAMVVQVAPQVNAEVEEVFVHENQLVTTGTPLFKLDASAYQQTHDQARAQFIASQEASASSLATMGIGFRTVQAAQSQVTAARQGIEAAKAAAAAAEESVASAKAQAQLAVVNFKRSEALLATKDISQQEYDQSQSTAESAVAELKKAELQVTQQKVGIAAAETQEAIATSELWKARTSLLQTEMQLYPLRALEAGIQYAQEIVTSPTLYDTQTTNAAQQETANYTVRERKREIEWMTKQKQAIEASAEFLGDELPPERAARESLNSAARDLANANITAPVAGWVTGLNLSTGTYVKTGTPAVALIAADQWWLTANYPENWIRGIRPGDKVLYSLRNYPGSLRTGTVASISRGVIKGQGLPNGLLPDTVERRTRQTDTPSATERFQVSINIQDDEHQPLRVGQTGRALIYASGGFPVINTLFTILAYVSSYMDFFFPKPSILLILVIAAIVVYFVRRRKKKRSLT